MLSLISLGLGLAALGINVAGCVEEGGDGNANRIMALVYAIISPLSNVAAPFGIQAVQEKCDPWVKAVPPVADLISYPVAAVFNLLVSLEVGKK